MKQLFFLLIMVCAWQASAQQPDTLYIDNDERVPNYYYWDSNWADIYWNSGNRPARPGYPSNCVPRWGMLGGKQEVAR